LQRLVCYFGMYFINFWLAHWIFQHYSLLNLQNPKHVLDFLKFRVEIHQLIRTLPFLSLTSPFGIKYSARREKCDSRAWWISAQGSYRLLEDALTHKYTCGCTGAWPSDTNKLSLSFCSIYCSFTVNYECEIMCESVRTVLQRITCKDNWLKFTTLALIDQSLTTNHFLEVFAI
jgi:hypothetical protein